MKAIYFQHDPKELSWPTMCVCWSYVAVAHNNVAAKADNFNLNIRIIIISSSSSQSIRHQNISLWPLLLWRQQQQQTAHKMATILANKFSSCVICCDYIKILEKQQQKLPAMHAATSVVEDAKKKSVEWFLFQQWPWAAATTKHFTQHGWPKSKITAF